MRRTPSWYHLLIVGFAVNLAICISFILGSFPQKGTASSIVTYNFPCQVSKTGNWAVVRAAKGFATDGQLLDDINTYGRFAHGAHYPAVDLNHVTGNLGPRTYGICEDLNLRAARSGTVIFNGWNNWGGGWTLTIDHGDGQLSNYLHMPNQSPLALNEWVQTGAIVGIMGCTGNCTGTHVHFDVSTSAGLTTNWAFALPSDSPFQEPISESAPPPDTPFSPPPDETPPTGAITSIAEGSVTADATFTLTADAADEAGSGVQQVEFYAQYDGDSHMVCAATSAPYSCTWDASAIADQTLQFTLHVIDHAANRTVDAGGTRTITLDRTAPDGYLIAPAEGSVSSDGNVTLTAEASDNASGVNRVEFYAHHDGTRHLACTATEAPYSCTWNAEGVADQPVQFTINVIDNGENQALERGGVRTVMLQRVDTQPLATAPEDPADQVQEAPAQEREHFGQTPRHTLEQLAP